MIIITALYLLCSIIYAIIGITTLKNDSKSRLNRIYFVICTILSLWAFMVTMMNASYHAETATMFRLYATFFWGPFYSVMLHFFIVMCGKSNFFKKTFSYMLLYSPAIITIYLYVFLDPVTVSEIIKVNLGWSFIVNTDKNFIFNHFYTVYYVIYTTASILLLWSWKKKTEVKREKGQAKVIILSLVIVTILGTITDVVFPNLGVELLPPLGVVLILVPVSGIWYSIKKYKLMDLNPQNVLLGVLKIMGEGLIVVNREGIIIDCNKGALKLLYYEEQQLLNKPIGLIFSDNRDISKDNDCSSLEIQLLTKNKTIFPVLFSSSTLRDEWGDKLGSVCIFQDISEFKYIQEKLLNAHDDLEKRVADRTLELKNANIDLHNEVKVRITMEEEIRKLALIDHLTGLPNRRLFNDRLRKSIIKSERDGSFLAILFLDLDLFKMINDTFGHTRGDDLLKLVASRLTNVISKSDTVARVGGDEFLILLNNLINEDSVKNTVELILNSIRQPFSFDNQETFVTTSIGIAMFPQDGKDVETLIKNADIAMYKAKEEGKNKYQFCNQVMKNRVYEDMKLTSFLYRALVREELELYYQPQVNTKTGEIIGLEALVRWHHPELGLIGPAHFIPIAEKTGLILSIGEWVLYTACRQNKMWQEKGLLDVPIAVNLSVNQFLNPKIVEQIETILTQTGLNPKDLEIEVTEGIFIKEKDYVIKTLEKLKKLGVTISIDDFGIEYSSLNYLKTLPIDKIKIAMDFVSGIGKSIKDEAIIETMIVLGKNLGLKVVAEGVETKEQVEYLKKNECDEIQGFYFYRPMPANAIEALIEDSFACIITISELEMASNID